MWDLFISIFTSVLLWIYNILGHGPHMFGIAIILFTILIRVVTWPLNAQQMKGATAMQDLQNDKEWLEIQKKYAKDKEKLAAEQMRIYRENGVNPLGGCLPALIPWPILVGLYQSITMVMGAQPEQLMDLSKHLYTLSPALAMAVPVNPGFLGLNLAGHPDFGAPLTLIIPALVLASTWVQQKMMTVPSTDAQSAQMNQSMQMMMPLFIGYISLSFPIGLSLYWIIFNVVGIVQQYLQQGGWGNLFKSTPLAPATVGTGKGKKNVGNKS